MSGATRYTIPGATVNALAVDSLRLFTSCGGTPSAGICTYNRATGAKMWSVATPASEAISVANGVVYTTDGRALRATDGTELAEFYYGYGNGTQVSVGDGYAAFQTDPRIIDIYGAPGS